MEYASSGKDNADLTTGIIGTAGVGLGLLANLSNFINHREPQKIIRAKPKFRLDN